MKKTLFSRAVRAFIALAVVTGFGVQELRAEPDVTARRNRRGFNLFASSTIVLIGNRVQCGLDNQGNTCTNVFGSPTGGGGFWPKNTPNQYIFNGGLQLAGILPSDLPVWAGDTVGAYIFDARGTQPQGEQLTLIYNSLEQGDVDSWPSGAFVRDGDVYNPALLGRTAISQQDSWVRYWDGSPVLLSGRTHPMGIMIEQRTLAWNFPAGNEDIIYLVYDFINITSGNLADYQGLKDSCEASKALAADPAVQPNIDCDAYMTEVAGFGTRYQEGVSTTLGVTLPAGGYRIDSLYAAFTQDCDVGNASSNSSTAVLPFDMGVCYKSDFSEPTWFYPPDINGAPFGPYPGYVGTKYLKSPIDPATGQQVGLTLFSNTENGATAFPDPVGVSQLWRYLSGNVTSLEGDRICSIPNPKVAKLCFLVQNPIDTRFFQSSGPFSLNPGEKGTIVVAFVHAAPIAAPLLAGGFTSGTNMPPGIPATGAAIAADPNAADPALTVTLRPLDFSAGWAGQNDDNADGIIQQQEVQTVSRSLLAKALVAQGIFDANFLLPFAPEPPQFFLVPGDNQVTVIWGPSVTETLGDPYFTIAANTTSPLFDPNYRQLDVEGYRVYRGRTGADLALIAQFDYAGTSLNDFNGAWDYSVTCAPELGAGFDGAAGECPIDFSGGGLSPGDPFVAHDVFGDMEQVSLPGRAALLTGGTVLLDGKLDTFWPDFVGAGNANVRALNNAGVPFAFLDQGVINSTEYFYAVTAFDVNSVNSGPSSLESAVIPQRIAPRASTPNTTFATLQTGLFGDDGIELDPTATKLTIDASTGRFDGPPPPSGALLGSFAPLVPVLLPALSLSAKLDSIVPKPGTGTCSNALAACYTVWGSIDNGGVITVVSTDVPHPVWSAFGDPVQIGNTMLGGAAVAADPNQEQAFGIPAGFSSFLATLGVSGFRQYIEYSAFEGQSSRRGFGPLNANLSPGGSRWFEGANETIDHPTAGIAVGSVAGVDRIWAPIHHTDITPGDGAITTMAGSGQIQCFGYTGAGIARQADVMVTWAGGTITVRDLTHRVPVDFTPNYKTGWGFVGDNDADGFISWRDFSLVEGITQLEVQFGFCNITDPGAGARGAFSATPIVMPTSTDGLSRTDAVPAATGTGFGLFINGERYIFELTGGALPSDGTEWTVRTYAGIVSASDDESATPTGYQFTQQLAPPVPGLQVQFTVTTPTTITASTDSSLQRVHTVPDPYYVTSSLEVTSTQKVIKFVNLPPRANIRIYSVSGILVDVINHDDPGGGGEVAWDVRNRNNQFVASGVYFYHVETPEGLERIGRFTVVNSSGIITGGAR